MMEEEPMEDQSSSSEDEEADVDVNHEEIAQLKNLLGDDPYNYQNYLR